MVFDRRRRKTQPPTELQNIFRPVRRQKMYGSAGGAGCRELGRQRSRRSDVGKASRLRLLRQRRLRTRPNDIIQRKIIAKKGLLIVVDINHYRQSGPVQPKKIKKAAVLPERIQVVLIIHAAVLIAEQQNEPLAQLLL